MKHIIPIILSMFLCFTLINNTSAEAYELSNISVMTTTNENIIQSMLSKLEQILNLFNKKGSITIECIDDNENVLLSKTYNNLKYGSYSHDAPEIEGYELLESESTKTVKISNSNRNEKIVFKYTKIKSNYISINTVEDMKNNSDLKVGDLIQTKGYYSIGDGGSARYEIMEYETWWNQLPEELKLVAYHTDRIGVNPVLYRNPVDNYGNHKLNNGLVAKIIEDDVIKVEQWGLFEGRDDNTEAMIQLFGNIHTGKIQFGKDKNYLLHYRKYNQCYENYEEILGELPWWLSKERMVGNEYALINCCRQTSKPALGNVKDLILDGNNCTIKIPDNEFCLGDTADFAIFETGGKIDGLEITNFNFDNNGLKQEYYMKNVTTTNEDGSTTTSQQKVNMRTCNHTISYFTSGINSEAIISCQVFKDYPDLDVKNYGVCDIAEFSNINIHNNNFYRAGTIVDTSDGGGDFILIINPTKSENIFIEDNYFEDWGRWVFAIDLGGNGERFYNYKFNRNVCVQTDNNCITRNDGTKLYRGLGFIDFEARKCFTNLEIMDNKVNGINGFAFNGNGKISENITIKNNELIRPSRYWRSAYPYSFTFYSVYCENLVFEDNNVVNGSVELGVSIHNLSMKNNNFEGTGAVGLNITGDCKIENNIGEGIRGQLFSLQSTYCDWITNENSDWYIPEKNRKTNILFKNNGNGGVCGTLINTNDPEYYRNTSLIFEENSFNKFSVNAYGLKEFKFDDSQLKKQDNGNPIVYVARGMNATKPSFCYGNNVITGGLHFEKGQEVLASYNGLRKSNLRYFSTDLEYSDFINRGKIEVVESGYIPIGGEFLINNADLYWQANSTANAETFYIFGDNIYYCPKAGTFGNEAPTHTYGTVENGDTKLMFFDKVAKIKVSGLEGQYMENSYYDDNGVIKGTNGFCLEILKKDVESNTKYTITSDQNTTRVCVTYFDENDNIIRTDRVDSYVGEFITPENCTRIRVGFKTSNQQSAMSYKMEKN